MIKGIKINISIMLCLCFVACGDDDKGDSGKDIGSPSAVIDKDKVISNLVSSMVYVEGGTFTMGATSEQSVEANNDESPTHQVTLTSFNIGRYEVTQEEWDAVMNSNPSVSKGNRRPVEQVSVGVIARSLSESSKP